MQSSLLLKRLPTSSTGLTYALVVFCLFTEVFANPIDSLKSLYYKSATPAEKFSLSLQLSAAYEQENFPKDSIANYLRLALNQTEHPEQKAEIYLRLHDLYFWTFAIVQIDGCFQYLDQTQTLLPSIDNPSLHAWYYIRYGSCFLHDDNLAQAIEYFSKAEEYLRDQDEIFRIQLNLKLSWLHLFLGNSERSMDMARQALTLSQKIQDTSLELKSWHRLASVNDMNTGNEATIATCKSGLSLAKERQDFSENDGFYYLLGTVALEEGKIDSAIAYFQQGLKAIQREKAFTKEGQLNMGMMNAMIQKKNLERAKFHGIKAKQLMTRFDPTFNIELANIYAQAGEHKKAFDLYSENIAYEQEQDSLINHYDLAASLLEDKFEQEKQQLQEEKTEEISREKSFQRSLLIALAISLMFLVAFASFYFSKQRANQKLRRLNEEILKQKSIVEEQHQQLKITQQQLIQSEKMASLGQLTAGIAHEIKNPLNFVNNFAKFSHDMAKELAEILQKNSTALDPKDKELIQEILADLQTNTSEINIHGTRADGIVQSMMNHASGARGHRQPYDVNKLLEESISLAYKGYKISKKLSIDIQIVKNLDENIPLLSITPQELSRVIVNLFNNASDAVMQKQLHAGPTYIPEIVVSSKKLKDQVEIRLKDNGPGIPKGLQQKIFNPFYTTKPTGEGNTGLGLSISHDIVVQGHNGSFELKSQEGTFSEFIIRLPL